MIIQLFSIHLADYVLTLIDIVMKSSFFIFFFAIVVTAFSFSSAEHRIVNDNVLNIMKEQESSTECHRPYCVGCQACEPYVADIGVEFHDVNQYQGVPCFHRFGHSDNVTVDGDMLSILKQARDICPSEAIMLDL